MALVSPICDVKYGKRTAPLFIQNEEYTVKTSSPYTVSLAEVPSEDYTISISGYTKDICLPGATTPLNFYVDYETALIYFYSSQAGENVSVTYYGTGSPIVADDINRFSNLFNTLKPSLSSFRVEALSGSRVRLNPGICIVSAHLYAYGELFIDFGAGGNFEISSISDGCFKKVIIGIDIATPQISVVEGAEALKYDAAQLPAYSPTFKPVAIVTIGSDFNILQKDIINVRNFLI